jgi:hypothetical protein
MAHTPQSKLKLSKAIKGKRLGNNNPMFGKTGELNPNYNNRWSEEKKQEFSERRTGYKNPNYNKVWSKEKRKLASLRGTGNNNPMFGKTGESNPNYGRKQPLWTCPTCNKTGSLCAMKGHHGKNGEKCLERFSSTNNKEPL